MASFGWLIRFMAKKYVLQPAPFQIGAVVIAVPAASTCSLLGRGRQSVDPLGKPGNLAGSVFLVDGSLDGGPVQHRTRILKGGLDGFRVAVLLDGDMQILHGILDPRFHDPVTGPTLKALTMPFQG